jgi:ser/thr/tyr protein kinase RAD53
MQGPDGYDGMSLDATQAETQQATQLSEPGGSQRPSEAHLWGYLIPCSPQQRRIDFSKDKKSYRIGRNREAQSGNDHILLGMKISEYDPLSLRW